MPSYTQSREDFETLESFSELTDFGPIEENLVALMQKPTRTYAAKLYQSAIHLWFQQHKIVGKHPYIVTLCEIAWRYGIAFTH